MAEEADEGGAAHLRNVAGVNTLAGLRRTRASHHRMKAENGMEPCWDCRNIARKVGLES